jgi:hypothetical protein
MKLEEERGEFVVLWSPETAEHDPDYRTFFEPRKGAGVLGR